MVREPQPGVTTSAELLNSGHRTAPQGTGSQRGRTRRGHAGRSRRWDAPESLQEGTLRPRAPSPEAEHPHSAISGRLPGAPSAPK